MGGLRLVAGPGSQDLQAHHNLLIQDTMRHPFEGISKPERLRENLSGFWSRRIDDTHRLVYTVEHDAIAIVACRYHYE